MWGSDYGEALRFLKDRVTNEDAFIEEVEKVTQHLRNNESYFRVNHAANRRLLRGDEDPQAIGIVANGNGYVFARKNPEPFDDRDTEQFCFLRFNRAENSQRPYLRTTGYAESLKFEEGTLPGSHYDRSRHTLYYRLLKEVSPHPDEDIRLLKPDYTPPGPTETVDHPSL